MQIIKVIWYWSFLWYTSFSKILWILSTDIWSFSFSKWNFNLKQKRRCYRLDGWISSCQKSKSLWFLLRKWYSPFYTKTSLKFWSCTIYWHRCSSWWWCRRSFLSYRSCLYFINSLIWRRDQIFSGNWKFLKRWNWSR